MKDVNRLVVALLKELDQHPSSLDPDPNGEGRGDRQHRDFDPGRLRVPASLWPWPTTLICCSPMSPPQKWTRQPN
jgi:hypothetical protein